MTPPDTFSTIFAKIIQRQFLAHDTVFMLSLQERHDQHPGANLPNMQKNSFQGDTFEVGTALLTVSSLHEHGQ